MTSEQLLYSAQGRFQQTLDETLECRNEFVRRVWRINPSSMGALGLPFTHRHAHPSAPGSPSDKEGI
jgi:hypothetical protein